MDANESIKGIIESLLFSTEKPITIEQIKEVIETIDSKDIHLALDELKSDYQMRKSGMTIVEVAGGFRMCTSKEYAPYLKKFYKVRHKEKLTMPSLETLAIVAYKQPVTRLDIESIRGVNVDVVIKNLVEKGLIRICGKKDTVGRPFVYGTTRQFLEYFGLRSLDELPKIEEFVTMAAPDAVVAANTESAQALVAENAPAAVVENEKPLDIENTEKKSEPESTAQENRQA